MLGRNVLLLKMIVNVTVKIKNILQHWYTFRGLEQRFFCKATDSSTYGTVEHFGKHAHLLTYRELREINTTLSLIQETVSLAKLNTSRPDARGETAIWWSL